MLQANTFSKVARVNILDSQHLEVRTDQFFFYLSISGK
jgi:hypothetical protein